MMTIEAKLGTTRFNVDEGHAHIEIDANYPDKKEKMKLVHACPAGLYKLQEDESLAFDYAGCLECGTCRVLSLGKVVTKWEYTRDTLGVEYRKG